MSAATTTGLDGLGFAITTPTSWYELPTHPAVRDQAIRRLVEDRVRGNDELWEVRRGIEKALGETAAQAHDAGAVYAAAFAMPTPDGPVTGSITVTLHETAPDGVDATGALLERFTPVERAEDGEPYARVGSVDIPTAGNCARVYGVEDISLDDGAIVVRTVFMQTAVVAGRHHRIFLVTAASPVVELEAELLEVFDAVTGTFRLTTTAGEESGDHPEPAVPTDPPTAVTRETR